MTTGTGTSGDCAIRSKIDTVNGIFIGSPYKRTDVVPDGLRLILALLDKAQWPIGICSDTGIGVNSENLFGGRSACTIDGPAIDKGPFPKNPPPNTPPVYPHVGITAYGCQLDCEYTIVDTLTAKVIVGKIDGQWHILRVLENANTIPMTGIDLRCRCCGGLFGRRMFARILEVSPSGCGTYRACQVFDIGKESTAAGGNPLGISISCAAAHKVFQDITDWEAKISAVDAEIISLNCCVAPFECDYVSMNVGGNEECNCSTGTGSFITGTGTDHGLHCRFEAIIKGTVGECAYTIEIWADEGDKCVRFADKPIEEVTAEACGLPNLPVGTRVIMARIPGGKPGQVALDGKDPVEWFVIRACTADECQDSCTTGTGVPVGPPCCGKFCSEMPTTLTATIEVVSTAPCVCASGSSFTVTLVKNNSPNCNDAANVDWFTPAPYPVLAVCEDPITIADPSLTPNDVYIDWLALRCGDSQDVCGDTGTGTSTATGSADNGPLMFLRLQSTPPGEGIPPADPTVFSAPVGGNLYAPTQNLTKSCCDPFYLEYNVTGNFCIVSDAGLEPGPFPPTVLKITITE